MIVWHVAFWFGGSVVERERGGERHPFTSLQTPFPPATCRCHLPRVPALYLGGEAVGGGGGLAFVRGVGDSDWASHRVR